MSLSLAMPEPSFSLHIVYCRTFFLLCGACDVFVVDDGLDDDEALLDERNVVEA